VAPTSLLFPRPSPLGSDPHAPCHPLCAPPVSSPPAPGTTPSSSGRWWRLAPRPSPAARCRPSPALSPLSRSRLRTWQARRRGTFARWGWKMVACRCGPCPRRRKALAAAVDPSCCGRLRLGRATRRRCGALLGRLWQRGRAVAGPPQRWWRHVATTTQCASSSLRCRRSRAARGSMKGPPLTPMSKKVLGPGLTAARWLEAGDAPPFRREQWFSK
jgi:hypothetical protein